MKKVALFATLGVAASLGTSAQSAQAANIVETAQAAGQFKTLIAAAKAAGLAPTLTGKGPLTVFAPTDAAFAKLPAGTVENLLKPENKATLATILKYHVIPGKVTAAKVTQLPSGTNVATAAGEKVIVRLRNGVMLDPGIGGKANVVKTDVMADNGVIHVIDSVILPPSVQRAMMGQ